MRLPHLLSPRPSVLLVLGAILLMWCSAASAATLSASDGRLSQFRVYGAYGGTLGTARGGDGGDALAFSSRVSGGSGYDYSRGRFNVSWPAGYSATYSGAFLLPPGFATAHSGQVSLMRWDNFGTGVNWESDSVNLNLATGTASLVHETVTAGRAATRTLAGPFPVPVGRWFTLRVSQVLGAGTAARNSVYVNGARVGYSTRANLVHPAVTAVRYGIVATSGAAQHGRIRLEFDRATATARRTSVAPPVISSAAGYLSPFTSSYVIGRTDMGVDICLPIGAPIRSVGRGVVLGIDRDWYTDPATGRAEPYIWYRLLSGPDAGDVIYVAEQINLLVKVGQDLTAGEHIATFARSGTCIETGWGDPSGSGLTDAQVTSGYAEGQVTPAGVSFARFLISLGLSGPFELTPTD